MNKLTILFPAVLVASVLSAQVRTPVLQPRTAVFPTAPALNAMAFPGYIMWSSTGANGVVISPNCPGEFPNFGIMAVPSGTYTITAFGQRGRCTCQTVVVP